MDVRDVAEWPLFYRRPFASAESTQALQNRRLRRVVTHAARNVPYYRELFRREGVDPCEIRRASDLLRIPVTTKRDLQTRPLSDFLTEGTDPGKMIRLSTSGSTGEPTAFVRSRREQLILQATRLRSQMHNGVRPGDVRLFLNSRWRTLHPLDRFGLFRMRHANGEHPEETFAALERLRPDVLMSRPSVLQTLASEAERRSIALPPVRLALVGGELLTPTTRGLIERVWGCRVFDEYGSNEAVLMAAQCSGCGQMHTVDDSVVVEVLDGDEPASPGEIGRVIGTALHSFVMPFIRFDFGDLARRPLEPVECRCGFGSLSVVEGRQVEFLRFPDGSMLSPYTVQRKIQDVSGVDRFFVNQDTRGDVEVSIESGQEQLAEAVRRTLSALVPDEVEVIVTRVDRIESSGAKFRYIKSAAPYVPVS